MIEQKNDAALEELVILEEIIGCRVSRRATIAQLDQAISDGLAAVATQDIIGWFTQLRTTVYLCL